jgi:chemotaxis signal transduction protein
VTVRLRSAEHLRAEFDAAFAHPPRSRQKEGEHLLLVGVAEQTWALRLAHVEALVSGKAVTPLPGPVTMLRGIAGVRGQLVPVYDLASLLGYPLPARAPWLVLVGGGAAQLGLAFATYHGHRRVVASAIASATTEGSWARERYQDGETSAAVVDLPGLVGMLRGKGR